MSGGSSELQTFSQSTWNPPAVGVAAAVQNQWQSQSDSPSPTEAPLSNQFHSYPASSGNLSPIHPEDRNLSLSNAASAQSVPADADGGGGRGVTEEERRQEAESKGLTPDYLKIEEVVDRLGGGDACTRGLLRSVCFARYWTWPSFEEFPYYPERPTKILQKMRGQSWFGPVAHRNAATITWTFLCVFITVATVGVIHEYAFNPDSFPILFASLGATVSIIFTSPGVEFTQPYNMLVGHIVPPFVAISTWKIFSFDAVTPWLPAALSASTSIAVMEALHGQNPAGGVLSLIYIVMPQVRTLGYAYIGAAMLGLCLVIAIAWVLNNAVKWMRWPEYWVPKLWLLQARAKAQVAEQMRKKSTQLDH